MYIQLTLISLFCKFSITLEAYNAELTAVTKLTKLAKVANLREKYPLDWPRSIFHINKVATYPRPDGEVDIMPD